MKYQVRRADGTQQEFDSHDALVIAFNRGEIQGGWAARDESDPEWRTVAEVLGVASPPPLVATGSTAGTAAPPASSGLSVGQILLRVFIGLAIALLLLIGICVATLR